MPEVAGCVFVEYFLCAIGGSDDNLERACRRGVGDVVGIIGEHGRLRGDVNKTEVQVCSAIEGTVEVNHTVVAVGCFHGLEIDSLIPLSMTADFGGSGDG